ncbi:MAG: hypothetical protein ABJQ71_15290 [Roseibium sp.]
MEERNLDLIQRRFFRALLLLVMAAILSPVSASSANDMEPAPKKWEFIIGAYGFIPWVEGTVGAGDLTSDLSLTPGDVLDALRFAAAVDAEVVYDNRFSATFDFFYANLGGAQSSKRGSRAAADLP